MKHVLALFAVVAVAGTPVAYAQAPSFGVRVGVNAADLSSKASDIGFSPKIKTGLVVGAFVEVPVNDVFSFQPEVLYSMQGAKADEVDFNGDVKLDYIQVPLLARFKTGKGSPVGILVGPSFGFRTKAQISSAGQTETIKDDTKSTDVGLVTGIGINAGRAVFDARYTWGLMNVDKGADAGDVKNRVFSASVGVRF